MEKEETILEYNGKTIKKLDIYTFPKDDELHIRIVCEDDTGLGGPLLFGKGIHTITNKLSKLEKLSENINETSNDGLVKCPCCGLWTTRININKRIL